MAGGNNGSNGSSHNGDALIGTIRVKQGLAQMLKGGVIVRFQVDFRCRKTIFHFFSRVIVSFMFVLFLIASAEDWTLLNSFSLLFDLPLHGS
jgi:hypothetical protein